MLHVNDLYCLIV